MEKIFNSTRKSGKSRGMKKFHFRVNPYLSIRLKSTRFFKNSIFISNNRKKENIDVDVDFKFNFLLLKTVNI